MAMGPPLELCTLLALWGSSGFGGGIGPLVLKLRVGYVFACVGVPALLLGVYMPVRDA